MVETWEVLAGLTVVLVIVGAVAAVTDVGNSPWVLAYVPILLGALYIGYWVGNRVQGE